MYQKSLSAGALPRTFAGRAYDAPPDSLVGWEGQASPQTPPPQSAPPAPRFSRLRRSIAIRHVSRESISEPWQLCDNI